MNKIVCNDLIENRALKSTYEKPRKPLDYAVSAAHVGAGDLNGGDSLSPVNHVKVVLKKWASHGDRVNSKVVSGSRQGILPAGWLSLECVIYRFREHHSLGGPNVLRDAYRGRYTHKAEHMIIEHCLVVIIFAAYTVRAAVGSDFPKALLTDHSGVSVCLLKE